MADAFRSARLVYRAIEDNDEDIEILSAINQESEGRVKNSNALFKPVNKSYSQQLARRLGDSLLSVLICLPIPPSPNDHHLAVVDDGRNPKPPTPIGRISLWRIDEQYRHHRSTNIGIHILAEHQRKGYGSEAIEWILNWAFRMAGLHRVGLTCFSYNRGAGELYERLGFVLEGRTRESVWYDGAWYDELTFGMLKCEWRLRNEKRAGKLNGVTASAKTT